MAKASVSKPIDSLLVSLSSPGPVFYLQKRVGRGYRRFGCIKFRTMRADADAVLQRVLAESPEMRDRCWGSTLA